VYVRSALAWSVFLVACTEYNVGDKDQPVTDGESDTGEGPGTLDGLCPQDATPPEEVGVDDYCFEELDPGGFTPEVEWTAGDSRNSRATPAVADLDGDGRPELIANLTPLLFGGGALVVFEGDGSGKRWEVDANLGYGSSPAVGDLDGDGRPEIVSVKALGSQLPLGNGTYAVVAYTAEGDLLFETEAYDKLDFNYASAPVLADMDHDGSPEIIAGRVILNHDGSLRGKGEYGQGSWGKLPPSVTEGSFPAVSDLDLDGRMEVIVGNAIYAPDGSALWHDPSQADGIPAIANLDDDPMAEIVVSSYNTVRALDHNGRVLWGPLELNNANIVSSAAIADVDLDGRAEILVAGGNQLVALNHDGTQLWSVGAVDLSGASGPSVFDFEGDGLPEVVYCDEEKCVAADGRTGAIKFFTSDHASDTMMEYPVIADIDADGEAEIIVSHVSNGRALSVYGSGDFEVWAPARTVWNQHAYSINNVEDDLSLPLHETPNFTTHNTWHSALAEPRLPDDLLPDLGAEILGVCTDDCGAGFAVAEVRVTNRSAQAVSTPVAVSLYAEVDGVGQLVGTLPVLGPIEGGFSSASVFFAVPTEVAEAASALTALADDDGTGVGLVEECTETNNHFTLAGPFCR
jgi:hypothetical protein